MKTIAEAFNKELTEAKNGQKTSLPFIRHQYSNTDIGANSALFQVLVIGGSFYKSALVQKKRGRYYIKNKKEGNQPVFKTKADFLTFVASHIDPTVTHVGINFAFPLTPFFRDGLLDGTLEFGTKEHAFTGLMGEVVGEQIEQYVAKQGGQKIRVGIANDTICLLLSGLTQFDWDQVAAGICGTGLNFALFLDEHTLVNLEAANFDKFEISPEAAIVDKRSLKPGSALTEKEVSGAYLHQIFNEGIKLKGIKHSPLATTEEIDAVAESETGEAQVYADYLLKRSAGLLAAQIAGITQFLNRDTSFVMEGSLFWKGYKYRERVEAFVREMIPERNVSYIHIPDSGIFGGAKLVA